jgi:hypothetical protein
MKHWLKVVLLVIWIWIVVWVTFKVMEDEIILDDLERCLHEAKY